MDPGGISSFFLSNFPSNAVRIMSGDPFLIRVITNFVKHGFSQSSERSGKAIPLVAIPLVAIPLVAIPLVAIPLVAILLVAIPLVAILKQSFSGLVQKRYTNNTRTVHKYINATKAQHTRYKNKRKLYKGDTKTV